MVTILFKPAAWWSILGNSTAPASAVLSIQDWSGASIALEWISFPSSFFFFFFFFFFFLH